MAKAQKKLEDDGLTLINDLDWDKGEGLLPAVIQHANTKDVLMLGYMTKEALQKTIETKLVTFFSRSRKELWTKGETSGNYLNLVALDGDCDSDTILIKAMPSGPTCHTGTATCFDKEQGKVIGTTSTEFIQELSAIIKQRRQLKPKQSYVAKLFKKGRESIAKKLGEEGVELALAHMSKKKKHTREEAADVLFHYLVLLEHADIPLSEVCDVLKNRHNPDDNGPDDHS